MSNNWLLLNKNMVSLDGTECNKVGTGYQAFQFQASKCDMERGSCLKNQISSLIDEDKKRAKDNISPLYSVFRYV